MPSRAAAPEMPAKLAMTTAWFSPQPPCQVQLDSQRAYALQHNYSFTVERFAQQSMFNKISALRRACLSTGRPQLCVIIDADMLVNDANAHIPLATVLEAAVAPADSRCSVFVQQDPYLINAGFVALRADSDWALRTE